VPTLSSTVVYTENSIHVSESPNVGDDDRAILPLPGPVRLADSSRSADLRQKTLRSDIS
jgi:hypothetical protein